MTEPAFLPALPILDPHHHLWDWPAALIASLESFEHGFSDMIRAQPRKHSE